MESVIGPALFYLEFITGPAFSYLESVVGPAAELHDAGLLVEGKIFDVHLAGWVVDGGRFPLHPSLVVQRCFGGQRHLEVPVSTASR